MKLKFNSAKIISFLWGGALLGSIIGFVTQIILARSLGPEDYGLLVSSLGTINLIMPLAGFGLASFWLKVFGEEGWQAQRWLKPSIGFLALSIMGVIVILLLWSSFVAPDSETKLLISILSITVVGQATIELVKSKLQLEENFLALNYCQLAIPILRLAAVSVFILFGFNDVLTIAISYSGISILVFIVSLLLLLQMLSAGGISLKGHCVESVENKKGNDVGVLDVINNSWVFGFATMFYVLWSQSNIVIIKYFQGNSEAGLYNIALIIITAVCILPSVVYSKYLMPKLHRWANHDTSKLKDAYYLGNKVMLVLGLIFMLLVLLLSQFIIPFFFGNEYSAAAVLLTILAFSLPFRFVGHSVGAMLVTKEFMKVKIKIMAFVGALNVVMNVIAISYFGLVGVAYIAVFNEFLLFALYYCMVRILYVNREWS